MVIVAETDEELARGPRRDAAPPRVLRLDARVQGRARRARLGRPAARAQPALEDRRLGDDGGDDHRRDRRHVRRVGHARADRARACRSATATSCSACRSTRPPGSAPSGSRGCSKASGRLKPASVAGSTVVSMILIWGIRARAKAIVDRRVLLLAMRRRPLVRAAAVPALVHVLLHPAVPGRQGRSASR